MTISEKVAYLKGMADGMELEKETSKEAKLLVKVLDVLEELGLSVEDLDDELDAVSDELDALSDDLSDVETMVFEDLDDDDEDEDDADENDLLYDLGDDFFEIECPSCGEDLIVDESVLDVGTIMCPNCGDKFSLDLFDADEAKEKESDPKTED